MKDLSVWYFLASIPSKKGHDVTRGFVVALVVMLATFTGLTYVIDRVAADEPIVIKFESDTRNGHREGYTVFGRRLSCTFYEDEDGAGVDRSKVAWWAPYLLKESGGAANYYIDYDYPGFPDFSERARVSASSTLSDCRDWLTLVPNTSLRDKFRKRLYTGNPLLAQ